MHLIIGTVNIFNRFRSVLSILISRFSVRSFVSPKTVFARVVNRYMIRFIYYFLTQLYDAKPETKSCNYFKSLFNGFSIKVIQP